MCVCVCVCVGTSTDAATEKKTTEPGEEGDREEGEMGREREEGVNVCNGEMDVSGTEGGESPPVAMDTSQSARETHKGSDVSMETEVSLNKTTPVDGVTCDSEEVEGECVQGDGLPVKEVISVTAIAGNSNNNSNKRSGGEEGGSEGEEGGEMSGENRRRSLRSQNKSKMTERSKVSCSLTRAVSCSYMCAQIPSPKVREVHCISMGGVCV